MKKHGKVKRDAFKGKENYTTADAQRDNEFIYKRMVEIWGPINKWPTLLKYKRNAKNKQFIKEEREITAMFRRFGFKISKYSLISQKVRNKFWDTLEKNYQPGSNDKEAQQKALWMAWCAILGAPTPEQIDFIHDAIFQDAREPAREVDSALVMSAYYGVIWCADFYELSEFLHWFCGREIELGWYKDGSFVLPLQEEIERQLNEIGLEVLSKETIKAFPEAHLQIAGIRKRLGDTVMMEAADIQFDGQ